MFRVGVEEQHSNNCLTQRFESSVKRFVMARNFRSLKDSSSWQAQVNPMYNSESQLPRNVVVSFLNQERTKGCSISIKRIRHGTRKGCYSERVVACCVRKPQETEQTVTSVKVKDSDRNLKITTSCRLLMETWD